MRICIRNPKSRSSDGASAYLTTTMKQIQTWNENWYIGEASNLGRRSDKSHQRVSFYGTEKEDSPIFKTQGSKVR